MGHSYMETGVTSWLQNCGIVIRLRLRRGDYVPVCPAGLQYLAFPSLGVRPLPSYLSPGPSATTIYYSCTSLVSAVRSSIVLVIALLGKEEGRKFQMTVDDGGKDDGNGSGDGGSCETTRGSGIGRESER